jgi:probable rRNA maturation factor
MVILSRPVAGVSRLALSRFLARAQRTAGIPGAVNVLVTGSREMRALNCRFRRHDRPTDVLSFPAEAGRRPAAGPRQPGADRRELGDIAISAGIAAASAARLGHRLADELKILMLHGLLHLAGYDHEHDQGEMERRESRLRRELRLPDSLTERL